MILSIVRTGLMNLRRDRAAFILSFVLPVAFFSIFAMIFGRQRQEGTPKVKVAIADEDHSTSSQRLVAALQKETALRVSVRPAPASKQDPEPPLFDAASAEAAVKSGNVSVAIVIPKGFSGNAIRFGPGGGSAVKIKLLTDSSDPIAPQLVQGLLQKTVMTSMPEGMAAEGMKYFEQAAGGITPQQRQGVERQLKELERVVQQQETKTASDAKASASTDNFGGMVGVEIHDVVGETKTNPISAFYAAGIGVMFLLFSASGAGGALLDEAESGTLDRILSTRVTMGTLLAGKWAYLALLGFTQLLIMFTWGALMFGVELGKHFAGFVIMASVTSLATASFGLMLASTCRTRAQLGAVSTLVILIMSALGGSMFPRFIMPASMQKFGLLTFNAWALDGFTKVFWREEPLVNLWPQVSVLLIAAFVFFTIARRLARRWEMS